MEFNPSDLPATAFSSFPSTFPSRKSGQREPIQSALSVSCPAVIIRRKGMAGQHVEIDGERLWLPLEQAI